MTAAIAESLRTEPLSLDKRLRQDELPVGLKNVGNTCYFNSFIQAFFFLPNMQEKLLKHTEFNDRQKVGSDPQDEKVTRRMQTSA